MLVLEGKIQKGNDAGCKTRQSAAALLNPPLRKAAQEIERRSRRSINGARSKGSAQCRVCQDRNAFGGVALFLRSYCQHLNLCAPGLQLLPALESGGLLRWKESWSIEQGVVAATLPRTSKQGAHKRLVHCIVFAVVDIRWRTSESLQHG